MTWIGAMFTFFIFVIAHPELFKSLIGFSSGIVLTAMFILFAKPIFHVLDEDDKNIEKESDKKEVCASSEAMSAKDKLQSEFSKLVSGIAWHNAGSGKNLHLLVRKEGEAEGKILISPEDMEKAFLEAAKLVAEKCVLDRCPCKTTCDKQTVLQRIRNIRKNFEEKSQTP